MSLCNYGYDAERITERFCNDICAIDARRSPHANTVCRCVCVCVRAQARWMRDSATQTIDERRSPPTKPAKPTKQYQFYLVRRVCVCVCICEVRVLWMRVALLACRRSQNTLELCECARVTFLRKNKMHDVKRNERPNRTQSRDKV